MKILGLAILLISSISNAATFNDIYVWTVSDDTLQLGDQIQVGVKYGSTFNYNSGDSVVIKMQHVNNDNTVTGLVRVYKLSVGQLEALPKIKNPLTTTPTDSLTIITFNLPVSYPHIGKTQLVIGQDRPVIYLVSGNPTGIPHSNHTEKLASKSYYSLSGQSLTHPTGLCIERLEYPDGTFETRKIFLVE